MAPMSRPNRTPLNADGGRRSENQTILDRRSPGKARLWPPDRRPRLWDRIAATQTVLGEQRGLAVAALRPLHRRGEVAAGEAVEEAEAGLARMPRLQAPIRA